MTFLSIVVPFHNSAGKCERLLKTLAGLTAEQDVELILVDDGSTDSTPDMLHAVAADLRVPAILLRRENGGPGAARNSGLDRASGAFVWFVDSDDDIDPGCIDVARRAGWGAVDLIAWNYRHPDPIMDSRIPPGRYEPTAGTGPAFDPVVANWFSRAFLQRWRIRFPEHCLFEAAPVEAFVLPLLVSSFVKADFTAYHILLDHPSITRAAATLNPGYYDRLQTASLGMDYSCAAALDRQERARFERDFVRLFLWFSIRLSRVPGPSWIVAARVMRHYRDEAKRLGIRLDPFSVYTGRAVSKMAARLVWSLSRALPSQAAHFNRLHDRAWSRPISWDRPRLPPAGA